MFTAKREQSPGGPYRSHAMPWLFLSFVHSTSTTLPRITTYCQRPAIMKRLLLMLLTLCASVAFARDVPQRCDQPTTCVTYYTTGAPSCDDGFKRTSLKPKGGTPGSYCERKCNAGERRKCTSKTCALKKEDCRKFPGDIGCADALAWCNEPIQITKANCVRIRRGRAVIYNDETGFCAYDPNPPKDDHYLSIYVRKLRSSDILYMSCDPVTAAGAVSVVAAMGKAFGGCDGPPSTVLYEIKSECNAGPEKFDVLKAAAAEGCAAAAVHPGTRKPTFKSRKG